MAMTGALYRTLTSAATPLLLLHLYWRRCRGLEPPSPSRWRERLGRASRPRPPGPLLWFHAVSVGEAMSAIPVIKFCMLKSPFLNILLTTSTVTSYYVLERIIPPGVLFQFAPIDTPFAVEKFLSHWHPEAGIFIESELWPNLLLIASLKGTFLALLNARMSSKSFDRWCHPAARPLSNKEAVRYQILGASPATIYFAGNLKYAVGYLDDSAISQDDVCELKESLHGRHIWIAASTHFGEEDVLASVHMELKQTFPNLITIIAPRHPERGIGIGMKLRKQGMQIAIRTNGDRIISSTDIYVADTIGELKIFYQLSSVAFVGGSLLKGMSGHNLAEAASAGCAVITGCHIGHFSQMVLDFRLVSPLSVTQVSGRDELLTALKALFLDSKHLQICRQSAQHAAEECAKGVVDKVWSYLETFVINAVTRPKLT